MKKLFIILVASIFALSVNAQSADYALAGFCDADNNVITTLALSSTDGLSPRVLLTNNGPDVLAATDTLFLDISISGTTIGALYLMGAQLTDLTAGTTTSLYSNSDIFSASDLDQMGVGTSFELCYTLRISGVSTDPDASNNNACITVTRATGINEITTNAPAVYPNPATDIITVANADNAQVTLYDMTGKAIYSEQMTSDNQTMNVADLTQGLYILRVVNGNNIITKKINIVK